MSTRTRRYRSAEHPSVGVPTRLEYPRRGLLPAQREDGRRRIANQPALLRWGKGEEFVPSSKAEARLLHLEASVGARNEAYAVAVPAQLTGRRQGGSEVTRSSP